MEKTTLWYVYISGQEGFDPIHGKVYGGTKTEAVEKMKAMAEEEKKALQAKEPWSDIRTRLWSNRARVYRCNEAYEWGYEDRMVTSYRIGYEKASR